MAFSDVDKEMAKRIVKQYCSSWDELRYDEIRNKPYFIGKKSKESPAETVFPLNCYKAMTFDELKTCIVDSGSTSVNMAVYNSDSTVVLYKAELGLKPPRDLKENEDQSASVDTGVSSSSKKRKTDSASNNNNPVPASVLSEQDDTRSNTDCLQIDLHPDSDLSGTENEDSEKSNICADDKQET